MKIILNKKQWEAMGKQAGWTVKRHVKTSSVKKISSEQSMVAQFMKGLQSQSITVQNVMVPMKIHPEIDHIIFLLSKKGIDIKYILEQSMHTSGMSNQEFKDQPFISFLYHTPEGKSIKEAILSIMQNSSSPQEDEYSFRRDDPTNPIMI